MRSGSAFISNPKNITEEFSKFVINILENMRISRDITSLRLPVNHNTNPSLNVFSLIKGSSMLKIMISLRNKMSAG